MLKKYALREIATMMGEKISKQDLIKIKDGLTSDYYDSIYFIKDKNVFESEIYLLNQIVLDCNGIKPQQIIKVFYEGELVFGNDLSFGRRFVEIHKWEGMDEPHIEDEIVDDPQFNVNELYIVVISVFVDKEPYPEKRKNRLIVYIA